MNLLMASQLTFTNGNFYYFSDIIFHRGTLMKKSYWIRSIITIILLVRLYATPSDFSLITFEKMF